MTEREEATRALRQAVERLRLLHQLGSKASRVATRQAQAEYAAASRRLSRISDGARR